MMTTTSEQLKAARKSAGLTQIKARKICHSIPKRSWENWERSISEPPPYVLGLILDKLEAYKEQHHGQE